MKRITKRGSDPAPPPGGVVVNLHPDPWLRSDVRIKQARPGHRPDPKSFSHGRHIYAHVHAQAEIVPGGTGNEVRVEGRTDDNDAYICPGGAREGGLRLRMRPGRRYTFAATFRIDAPLTGVLHRDTRRIAVDWIADGELVPAGQRSPAAENRAGSTRLAVTFTVPENATEAWIRLVSGASRGHGTVWWSGFALTETSATVPVFDGATPDDERHVYAWRGEPHASASTRTLLPVDDPAIGDKWLREAIDDNDLEDITALLSLELPLDPDSTNFAAALLARANRESYEERARLGAVGSGPYYLAARLRLASVAIVRREWARAIEILTPLAEAPDAPAEVFYRLGRAHAGKEDLDAAFEHIRTGALRDSEIPAHARDALLQTSDLTGFAKRMDIWRLTEAALDEIRARAAQSLAQVVPRRPRVFTLWGQGPASAPPVTAACLRRMRTAYPGDELVVLTEESIPYWADCPEYVRERVGEDFTHLSDIVRIELLKRYGGFWMDATCWITGPLPAFEQLAAGADFFALRRSPTRIASWLLGARNTSYIVHMLSAALAVYWERHDELIDYFLLHHTFETLCHLDERFAQEFARTPVVDADPPHELQRVLREPYDPDTVREIMSRGFVHKLTYKFLTDAHPDWTVSALVRGELDQVLGT